MIDTPRHYLLVDDSPSDRMLAQEAFEHVSPSCTLTCIPNGQQAMNLLREGLYRPDVILLDINMPGMNGFQVLEQLKHDPEMKMIPVVMLSTSSAQSDVSAAYSLHASSYLVKSSGFEDFLKQVETFLEYWRVNRVAQAQEPQRVPPSG